MLVAAIALTVALAGTAMAAPEVLTKETVRKIAKQEAKKQVEKRAPGIADEQIAARAPGLSVASAQSANTAGSANVAANADNAATVGGLGVTKFARSGVVSPSSPTNVLRLGGLELEYACISGGFPDLMVLNARTTVNGASIYSLGAGGSEVDESFQTGEEFVLGGFVGAGSGVYSRATGQVVTFNYRNSTSCAGGVAGTAYGG